MVCGCGFEVPDGVEKWDSWVAGKGIDIGTCDFNLMHGKMLIESGTFNTPEIGEAFAKSEDNLEVSIAFSHPTGEPGKEKRFENIHRYERSLLPEGMASNLLTTFSVKGKSGMKAQDKVKMLIAILGGKSEVAQQILDDAATIEKAAEAVGLEYKEVKDMVDEVDEVDEVEQVDQVETPIEPEAETPQEIEPVADAAPEQKQEGVIKSIAMTQDELKLFVVEVVKELVAPSAEKSLSDQAEIDQKLSDVLETAKSMDKRLKGIEDRQTKQEKDLEELADAHPAGIKQLQNMRASQRESTVTTEKVTGPVMDEFRNFSLGGN